MERLKYVDVAKGLLIILLLVHHVPSTSIRIGITNQAVYDAQALGNLFVSFFMPCFFVLTGYCTNYNKSFYTFLIGSIKGVVLPALFFTAVFCGLWHIDRWAVFARRILIYGGDYWFLSSLFLARILYWAINRYCNKTGVLIISVFSFCLGFLLRQLPKEYEVWYFVHALFLMPYMSLGHYLRSENIDMKRLKWAIPVFVISFAITILLSFYGILHKDSSFDVPAITYSFMNLDYSTIVPLVLLSIFGSLTLIYLSMKISASTFLEYVGRNSLVIYCAHIMILYHYVALPIYRAFASDDYWINILLLITCFLVILGVTCILVWFMNLKYLRCLIGKF